MIIITKNKYSLRILSILVLIIILFSISYLSTGEKINSNDDTYLNVMIPCQTCNHSEPFNIIVRVIPGVPIWAVETSLSFDPSLVQAVSVVNANPSVWTIFYPYTIDNTVGTITGMAVNAAFGGSGTFDPTDCFEIMFVSLSTDGTSDLTLYNAILLDDQTYGKVDSVKLNHGEVIIGDPTVGLDDDTPSEDNTVEDVFPPPDTTQSPIANATVDKNIGVPGEVFMFDASQSYAFEGKIVDYTWDFHDGTILTTNETVISHVFISVGLYHVMLTVEDEQGLTNTLDNPLIIEILADNAPPGNLTITPETLWTHKNTDATFVMNATDPDVNDTIRFVIDWGDGNTSFSDRIGSGEHFQINHQWDTFGVYIITIIAFDEHNASSAPVTMMMKVDVILIDDVITGWLIDINSDDTFDFFKNLVTSEMTTVEEQDDGRYLIDSTNDGKWNYIYCSTDGLMKFSEGKLDETPGFTLILLILSFVFYIIFLMKKKE